MAKLQLNTYQLQDFFSDLAGQIQKDLSKKEKREVQVEEIQYFVEYAQRIQAMNGNTFANMIAGMAQGEERRGPRFDGASYMFSALSGQLGRKKSSVDLSLEQKEVVVNIFRYNWEEEQARQAIEKARFDALTPEQQRAELEESLRQLRGPGFIELRVDREDDE